MTHSDAIYTPQGHVYVFVFSEKMLYHIDDNGCLERRQRGQDYGLQSEGTLTVIVNFLEECFIYKF